MLPALAAGWEPDAVEVALGRALTDASSAGRFEIVVLLVKELEGRRLARRSGAPPVAPGMPGQPRGEPVRGSGTGVHRADRTAPCSGSAQNEVADE
jgi:hypothetical protein